MTPIESMRASELFAGLTAEEAVRVAHLGSERDLREGETVFRLGAEADTLFVVRDGRVDLAFPLVVLGEPNDVRFQSIGPGKMLAWSALVPPHRLTMSARAGTDCSLLAFPREPLLALLEAEPRIGFVAMSNLARVVGARLQETQALWVREVQRSVSKTYR